MSEKAIDENIWLKVSSGTLVAEASTLEAMDLKKGKIVDLPGFAGTFSLDDAKPDRDGLEIAGWRFEKNGQKYLVIND